MSGRAARRLSVAGRLVLALGLTALGAWPAPASAGSGQGPETRTVTVPSLAEAWYARPEPADGTPEAPAVPDAPGPCSLPIGCPPDLPAPLPSPLPSAPPTEAPDSAGEAVYPAGTLHVELTAGRPTAKAFLVPDLTRLPADATVLRGRLVLPVSQEQTSGNRGVATARFGACLVTSEVTDGDGGRLSGAPTYDCRAAAAPATYRRATSDFVVDLGPFIARWRAGAPNYGVALVPTVVDDAAGALAADASWHVALNGSRVTSGEKSASTLQVRLAPGDEAPADTPGTSTAPPAPVAVGGSTVTASGGGGIVTPVPPTAAATAPVPAQPAATPLDAAPTALLGSPWYTYRGVVFLPLAFLVALSLTGRALTRPLAAVGRRPT